MIVTTTRSLLLERGYGSLNFDTVAAQAGVAKTTIYRRWPNKADLVLDVLEREFGRNDLPAATLPRLEAVFDPSGFPGLAGVIAALAVDTDGDATRRARLRAIIGSAAALDDLEAAHCTEWYCGIKLFHALITTVSTAVPAAQPAPVVAAAPTVSPSQQGR